MSQFPVHTISSAPEASRPALDALAEAFGTLPNIAGVMAGSPRLINGLVGLFQQVHGGSFSEAQIQTLLLTDAVANGAEWAVAFHSHLARQEGLDDAEILAIRAGDLPRDPQLAALSRLAKALIGKRGRIDAADIAAFTESGFETSLVLEVILVVAASTITNYSANVAQPPLEAVLRRDSWRQCATRAGFPAQTA